MKQDILNEAKQLRRKLHEYPELSAQEYETSAYLKKEMSALGLTIQEVNETSFLAILDTGQAGKTVALRTDIDALPLEEDACNLKQEKLAVSKNRGVMHACGHDFHMATLVMAAKLLVRDQANLRGKVIFIFEDGEEIGHGIVDLVDALKDMEIDCFYGNHVWNQLETGKIVLDSGPVMAGAAGIDIEVEGRSGHSSRPDQAVNPVFAAASMVTNMGALLPNTISPEDTVAFSVSQIHAGKRNNIIPSTARMSGNLRFFEEDAIQKALEMIQRTSDHIAKAYGCQSHMSCKNQILVYPVVNDPYLSDLAKEVVQEEELGDLAEGRRWFASETFSEYREIAPSLFALVGIKNEDLGSGASHHSEAFDVDDEALELAICTMVGFTKKFLQSEMD